MRSIGVGWASLNAAENRILNGKDVEFFAKVAEENLCVPLRIPLRPLRLSIVGRCSTYMPRAT